MKPVKLFIFLILFTLSFGAFAQSIDEDSEEEYEYEMEEDTVGDDYYYDWDMTTYSIGLNLNSLLAFNPAFTVTHDIGLDDYTRVAIETSYIPDLFDLERKGFKLRGTYQKFFYKDDLFGFYCGAGINIVSFWEARSDMVFLENTYWRTFKEIRNQTHISGIAEAGMTLDMGNSYLLELTVGAGAGYRRVGGSYVIINEFDWEPLFGGERDPGNYWIVPIYCNLSFSFPVLRMF